MAAAKTATKTAPTVTLKHLAANVAESHELSKKQSEAILGNMIELIVKHLKKGDRIRIGGLGILQVRKRAARMGRNPATGEPIKIPAKTRVKATVVKAMKDAVMPRK
jgi:DNA-binding protein HU-beta